MSDDRPAGDDRSTKTATPRPDTGTGPPETGESKTGGQGTGGPGTGPRGPRRRSAAVRGAAAAGALVVAAALPFYLDHFWLNLGLLVAASVVGALGLDLLVGHTGQISLAHPFFIATGGYGYTALASDGSGELAGAGWPTALAALGAIVLAGVAGALYAPISARVRGIYLAVASLGLVVLGQHLLLNLTDLTGGYDGRDAPPLNFFGLAFDDGGGDLLGVPFGRVERLWYVALAVAVAAYALYASLRNTRPGRALAAIRGGETAAAAMGVHVPRYKAAAFAIAAAYAGAAGVLLALTLQRLVPSSYEVEMAFSYMAMIVIGGLGSPLGAVLGAAFVTSLPILLRHYSDHLPLLAAEGSGGLSAGVAAQILYGAAVVAVLLFARGGLAGACRAALRPRRRPTATKAGIR
ncbi:branched-chain amino acid ABC transporter permease [Streptomyces sp. B22F1]|uniref:branched-chain amino acid ABC transporter permease n=1 Tax=Streptomyces sp. B22F1 TaxID=3153566 RepID=UPI00119C1C43